LAQQHKIHPHQITTWKQQLLEHAGEVFANGHTAGATDSERRIQELHTKIAS
jgi:transposase-like protein